MSDTPRRPTVSLVAIEGSDADPAFTGYVARLVDITTQYVKDGGCVEVTVSHDQDETVRALREANAALIDERDGLKVKRDDLQAALVVANRRIAALEAGQPPTPPQRPALPLEAITFIGLRERNANGSEGNVMPAGTTFEVFKIASHPWKYGDNRADANNMGTLNVWAERLVFPALAIPWPLRLADPLGHGRRINQPFGVNPQDYAKFGLDGHNGLDLLAKSGDEVRACAQGIVYNVEQADGNAYGCHVQVAHTVKQGDEWHLFLTTFAHFKDAVVQQGDVVLAGDLLGHADSTGNSTGDHLHLGLDWIDHGAAGYGQAVDPLPYLDFA